MPAAAIDISAALKRYGKVVAVQRFDLTLSPGTICGLAGPNGAGKSTTIGMLLGLVRPTAGRLRVLDLDPTRQSLRLRQRIGYIPEKHHIYGWMRGSHVLRFASMIYPTWDRAEAKRLVDLLGVPISRRVKEMSKGELAKLAMIIALAHAPALLVLDEPTSGLDPLIRRELLAIVSDIARRRKCTVLFSTHILSDLERIADRVVVMNGGRVLADDSVDALRARFMRASMLFATPPAADLVVPDAVRVEKSLREWVVTFGPIGDDRVHEIARQIGATDCMIQRAALDDVFAELIAPTNGGKAQAQP